MPADVIRSTDVDQTTLSDKKQPTVDANLSFADKKSAIGDNSIEDGDEKSELVVDL
jgi:hypothetical protein